MFPESLVGDDFGRLLDTCRHFLLTVANAELPERLRAKGGASDLVQEAFAAAHSARGQFRGTSLAELRAWLRSILLNELAMFRRRYLDTASRDVCREVSLTAHPAGGQTPVAELTRRERDQRLSRAVDRLPDGYRQVVLLRVENGLDFDEIGRRTGRTAEAARKAFARALGALRESSPDLAGDAT